jgi:peptidoglycan/LPS O-acetylase OafA/YrhL
LLNNSSLVSKAAQIGDAVVRHSPSFRTSGARHTTYRADIDGLRAIAVISVFGYHLQISWLSGGFVGVDIFFVISGYLISSIIIGEAKNNNFSVLNFYVRRIKRIIPALVFMIICVFTISYFILFPLEYMRFSESAFYSALSASNFYFLHHSGYFDALASSQPLLHTWSLAVEEQFYIVFPLFVIVAFQFVPRLLNESLVLIWIASFALSAYGAYAYPESTFYLAHTRAWELLLGTLVANQSRTATCVALTRNLLALFGLALIGVAIVTFSFETPFPGAAALMPCVGAALIIAAGQSGHTFVGNLLSLRPVVFIGLISYSLYLWHWPIIFFQRTDSILITGASRLGSRLIVLVASLIAATLSWQCVEKPFRRQFKTTSNLKVFISGFFGLGSLVVIALLVVSEDGFPSRFSSVAVKYASYLDYGQEHFREGKCFIVTPYKFSDFDRGGCLDLDRNLDHSNYLLIGDSHAAQLWYGLSRSLTGVHVLQATAAGCLPEFTQPARVAPSCKLLMDFIFNSYLAHNQVDRLLIAARWSERDMSGLERVLAWADARAIPVTLFGPMVEYDLALPRILAYAAQNDDPRIVDSHRVDNNDDLDKHLQSLATTYGARYVSFYKLLCKADYCIQVTHDGLPLEFDTDHLTKEGSVFVVQELIETKQLP